MDAMINQAHAAIINFTGQGGDGFFIGKKASATAVVAATAAATLWWPTLRLQHIRRETTDKQITSPLHKAPTFVAGA